MLVPSRRADEISRAVPNTLSNTFKLIGDGPPWSVNSSPSCAIGVIFWEDVLARFSGVKSEPFSSDLAQFQAMYLVLKGHNFESPRSDAEVLGWREKEANYVGLVEQVTRLLAEDEGEPVLPMQTRGQHFTHRYVCMPLGSDRPHFSIGTSDPTEDHKTFIWMRFHRNTPRFADIERRLLASPFSDRVLKRDGNIWIPLDVRQNVEGDHQVVSLLQQARDIIKVASAVP